MDKDYVILVDQEDHEIGTCEKMLAHRKGLLHRAFSVFLFNENSELLLQQRAWTKYHSGGVWSNTVCSHPKPGESIGSAARRRLAEEMGIDADLWPVFSFIYRAEVGSLIEYEYDHVLVGSYSGSPEINLQEVTDWTYLGEQEILKELTEGDRPYSPWFKMAFPRVMKYVNRGHDRVLYRTSP